MCAWRRGGIFDIWRQGCKFILEKEWVYITCTRLLVWNRGNGVEGGMHGEDGLLIVRLVTVAKNGIRKMDSD